MTNCLLVVDVQNGFVSDNTAYVVPRIKELIESKMFDYIISTQFINPEDGPYIRYMNWHRLQDSPDIDVLNFVKDNSDLIIKKNIYSAVTPEFEKYISDKRIDSIFVVGIDTDCCVLKTATDLFEKNYDFKILVDYTASNGGEDSFNSALTVMRRMIGTSALIRGKPEL